ncbi:hypothetical protein Tco_1413208, partial [Tanacetum coccineum]
VVKSDETDKEREPLLKDHGCLADPVQTVIGPDRQSAGGSRNWAVAEDDQTSGSLGLGRLKDKLLGDLDCVLGLTLVSFEEDAMRIVGDEELLSNVKEASV